MYWFLLWFGDGAAAAGPPGGGSSFGTEAGTGVQVEVWSNLQCAGGTRLAAGVPAIRCTESQELGDGIASSRLELEYPSAWEGGEHVASGRVIRLAYPNGDFDEFRIDDVVEHVPRTTTTVTANSVIFDLAHANALISETTAQRTDYEVTKVDTPTNLMDFVRGFAPSYFSLGTITPTAKVSVTFTWTMPLGAYQSIASAVKAYDGVGGELSVRRNGIIGYFLDLTIYNSSAPSPDIRTGKNLLSLSQKTVGQQVANRVYPQVPWSDQLGIGEHHFIVTAVSTDTYIAIDDPAFRAINPIAEDDALNGLYWVPYNEGASTSTARLITDTVRSTKRIYMSSTSGIAVGDYGRIARNSTKDTLAYVEKPSSQASVGIRVITLTVPEIALDNVLPNASTERWTSGQIDYWVSNGTVWPAEETSIVYTGTRSARFQNSTSSGDYNFSARAYIWTTRSDLKLMYRVWHKNLRNGAGSAVGLQVDGTNPVSGAFTDIIPAQTTERLDWHATTSAEYSVTSGGRRVLEIRIRNTGTTINAARAYIGLVEALVYQSGTALPSYPILGSNSTGGWLRGVNLLVTDPVTYEVSVADLTRADSSRWPYDQLLLGGNAAVTDTDTGTAASLRVVGLVKDHLNPLASRVTFTQLESRLSGLVAAS